MIKQIIQKSLKDFLTPAVLSISFLPFIITFAVILILYLILGDSVNAYFQNGVSFVDAKEYPKLAYILSFSFFKWLFIIFFYVFGAVFVIVLSVIIATIVVGFFTPKIIKIIHQKYYNHLKLPNEENSIILTILSYTKILFIFLILLIISLPFMFVPIVNVFALALPFYYLFHNFLVLDVGLSVNDKKEFKSIIKKYKLQLRSTTLSLYLLSLIPFVGIIFQVLFVIVLTHFFFLKRAT